MESKDKPKIRFFENQKIMKTNLGPLEPPHYIFKSKKEGNCDSKDDEEWELFEPSS